MTAQWSNWSGRQTASPQEIARPRSEADFVAAIERANERNWPIRAVGASHSHSRVAATDGLLLDLDDWQGVISTDADAKTATMKSGTRIFQLGEPLHAAGLAVRNQGDIDRQSVAGATATGTHGTGPTLQNLSMSVRSLRIALASGDIVDVDASTGDLFQVARHSLGGLGAVIDVTLNLRDAYRLHEHLWAEHPDTIFERIDNLTSATRHFEFFWMPKLDKCAAKTLDETDAEPDDMPDNNLERIGWSHDIISSTRDDKHTEMEYSVPAEHGPACFNDVRKMIQQDFPELVWPLEYRTVKADDIWISAAGGRETVTISAHQDITLDDRDLFNACEEIFNDYEGRPHWGKVHNQTGDSLAKLHTRYRDWWNVRDTHDPRGTFVTPELEALRPSPA